MHIPTPIKKYLLQQKYTHHTFIYIHIPTKYLKNIPTAKWWTLNFFACICRYLVGIKEVFRRYSEVFDQYFAVLKVLVGIDASNKFANFLYLQIPTIPTNTVQILC